LLAIYPLLRRVFHWAAKQGFGQNARSMHHVTALGSNVRTEFRQAFLHESSLICDIFGTRLQSEYYFGTETNKIGNHRAHSQIPIEAAQAPKATTDEASGGG